MLRFGLGAILSPLATPLAIWCVTAVFWMLEVGNFGGPDSIAEHSRRLELLLGPGMLLAYFMMLVAGLPMAAWSERRGRTRYADAVKIGVLVGVLPFMLYFLSVTAAVVALGVRRSDLAASVRELTGTLPDAVQWLVLAVASGTASASLFWAIAWRGRRAA
jgi:hypothetical protein